MNEQNSRGTAQIGAGKQIVLHLGPGLMAVGLFVLLNAILPADRFPPFSGLPG